MSNIKVIYYNQSQISRLEIEQRVEALHLQRYTITNGLMLVKSHLSVVDLYNALNIPEKWMLIVAMDNNSPAYWGYMNNTLWEWLSKNSN